MFFNFSSLFFFPFLLLGVLIAVSSSSWFGAWLGLELNLLSFIPMISISTNSFLSEAALKYFLIQALGSATIILASSFYLPLLSFSTSILMLALLLKMGAAPFHFWFPQVMSGMQWLQTIILLTIQKISPMILVSYIYPFSFNTKLLTLSAVLSAIFGALGGFNSLNLRKIIAFSSINHMSWMLIAFYINSSLWVLYFLFYSLISSSIILFFFSQQSYSLSNTLNFFQPLSILSLLPPFYLLSLGGLPPFSGFIPKWIIIQAMMQQEMYFSLFFLLSSALITLFYYLRISIPFFLIFSSSLSLYIKKKKAISPFHIILGTVNFLGFMFPLWSTLM
nr:NADH dehydrogenase subunit 2 [Leptomithrax sp. QNL-2021]